MMIFILTESFEKKLKSYQLKNIKKKNKRLIILNVFFCVKQVLNIMSTKWLF